MPGVSDRKVDLLVVDDSAVIRQAMVAIAKREPGMSVRVASDPLIAFEKLKQSRPDVILLDIEMPRMDGLTFLRKLMADDPIPVVICSALAGNGTDVALRALEEGAVDVVAKPKFGVGDFMEASSASLINTIRSAARASRPRRIRTTPPPPRPDKRPRSLYVTSQKVIAVGASTGGCEALRELLQPLPVTVPGLVIVQHMPEVFTARFAHRLDEICQISVKEAENGDRVADGRALIAPGNKHIRLVRDGAEYRVEVFEGPFFMHHRPSVEILFRSAAETAGKSAIGVIMTGMGADGAAGLLEMRKQGAKTFAQDEGSCVVFGMPREAIRMGAAEHVLAPQAIAEQLVE
jgi:two-component system, chemotaxis family, protein-glutamate methylesterase/glutaminase